MKETRFKQTEIGLIPEDWEIRKLGSIFKFIPNNTISRDNLVNQGTVMNVHYGDILIKYGSILDIKNNDIPFINDSIISNSKFNEFAKDGDILIADTAEDEMVCKATELYNIENRKLVSGLHTMWIRPIIEFKPKYLGYFFNSTFYHNQILPLIQGTKVCSVSKGAIKDTYVSIPLENEQNKIASALTSIDNLLLSLDKLIEKKRLIKQGAMQELLTGKKRLPGFAGEWVERRLGEISKIYRGGSPRPIENYLTTMNDGINWIKIGDVDKSAKYIYKTQERIKPSGVSSSRYVKSGDFLLSNSMSFGRPYILKTSGCIHDGWLVIQDYQQYCDCDFLYYTLSSNYILHQYKAKAAGSSVLNLNKDIASNVIMKYPKDILEQKAIAKVLSSIDKEIESLEGKKAKYEQIKQGMMQQLLTGKIRLIS